MKLLIINGPNLNMLGQRDPDTYGHLTLAEICSVVERRAWALQAEVTFYQANGEGELIDFIQQNVATAQGIIINPGAFTHTSVAILDALNAFDGKVVEVHLSNIHKREAFRHHSYVSLRADGIIAGLGSRGYLLALDVLL